MRLHVLAAASFMTFALPLLGEAGDAAAVIQHCGTPTSEHQGVSQVTNRMERDLTYGSLILHFQPTEDGWSFLSGWYDHLPMTKAMVESRLPCFREAMAASLADRPENPATYEDPAVRAQTTTPVADNSTFGIPHLWLILLLAALVLLLFFLPGARRRRAERMPDIEKMRYRRKPRIVEQNFRRGPDTRLDV